MEHLADPQDNSNYFVRCAISGLYFLIDTGASLSFLPRTWAARTQATVQKDKLAHVVVADGRKIAIDGFTKLTISVGPPAIDWKFYVTSVDMRILGCDFFVELDLLIDVKNERLLSRTSSHTDLPSLKATSAASLTHHVPSWLMTYHYRFGNISPNQF